MSSSGPPRSKSRSSESSSGGSSKFGGCLWWVVGIIVAIIAVGAIAGALGDDSPEPPPRAPRIAAAVPTETPAPARTPLPTFTAVPTSTPAPSPTASPTAIPTPTPTPTPSPTPTSYGIDGLRASYVDSGGADDEVTVDFAMTLRNAGDAFSALPLEARMSVNGGDSELVSVIAGLGMGDERSFVFSRNFAPGVYNVAFTFGDARAEVEVNVEANKVALALATPTPTATHTPIPTATHTPIPTHTPLQTETPPTATSEAAPTESWLPTALPNDVSPPPTATPILVNLRSFMNGAYLLQRKRHIAESILKVSWIADGVEESEREAVQTLINLAASVSTETLAMLLMEVTWFADGVSEDESEVIRALRIIAREDAGAAARIIAMPFLESLEPPDEMAVKALTDLVVFNPDDFADAMSRPALVDGVTDSEAPIVAMLRGVYKTEPDLVNVLLDQSKVYVERKTTRLQLSGDVVIVIVRTNPGAERGMTLVENAVIIAENLMARPLPTNYVGVLFEDAVASSFAGANFGTHIAIRPKYDVDDGSREAIFAPHNIAHEVAHYYWRGNSDWVDEGMADFMASAIENRRDGKQIGVTNDPCPFAKSVAELEGLKPDRGDLAFRCNYSLGERLFFAIHRTLGEDAFWSAARNLYDVSRVDTPNDRHSGTSMNISHVRDAFSGESESAATVISRWYDGTEAHDISGLDTREPNPRFSAVSGEIGRAYVSLLRDGPETREFSADDASGYALLNLKYSYQISDGQSTIPLKIVEFHEDGLEFRRRISEITAESQYIGGTTHFYIGSSPWATGRYWVYLYEGENKLAEATYEVVP